MSENKLRQLFREWAGEEATSVTLIPGAGSDRQYFRLTGLHTRAVGVYGADTRENEAFLSFTRTFRELGLPVPEILAQDVRERSYLVQDLGDLTLYGLLTSLRKDRSSFPEEAEAIYREVVRWLPAFQVGAAGRIDYGKCYPRDAFDRRSMLWDLNYFKYYFLKLARVPFDEQALEEDFQSLASMLLAAGTDHFMYRDFQSRNIMVVSGSPWFIDYQGGRRGALQYDIASLLYDAKADIPEEIRSRLLDQYLAAVSGYLAVDPETFLRSFPLFVLIRILQALGAYGFRGYYENKPHFLQSIPYALGNLRELRASGRLDPELPELMGIVDHLVQHPSWIPSDVAASPLVVTIRSFSYKDGIPEDPYGHGGGFVFDCRALPNPGRYEEYARMTGKDPAVIGFLKKERDVEEFLSHACSLVDASVRKYMERGFEHLTVNFGCTGGRHRSVYCSEELAAYLKAKYQVSVDVIHINI